MSAIKILIADDNRVDRMVLSQIVRNQGHDVCDVSNGKEAVKLFREYAPDIVLLDVMMPEMNGKEAARRIKAESGENFVPIIFLTSLTDAQSLADCLESGGDDFLSKPYNPTILQAKIDSFSRMRDMHQTLQRQRDLIASNNEHLLREQQVAKAVFDNVAHDGCLSASNIRYMLSPLSIFNGDVLLAAHKPAGGMHILLGDFTGHGLPAAIGAMPLAEIFYGMTAKGFALRDILREINLKLKGILPVSFFCCAVVVDLDSNRKTVNVWMGGVPDCYLLRAADHSVDILSSSNLPLGVLDNEQFKDEMQELPMSEDDRLFLWSDGIIEARNNKGEMFGEQRLKAIFSNTRNVDQVFDQIQHQLMKFTRETERDDDTTLIEVRMASDCVKQDMQLHLDSGPLAGPIDWQMNYRLGPDTLKNFNPLPLMIHIMMEVPGLRAMGGQLYTVMAELFSNAFEHGVLGLDSSMKASSDGFMRYYQEREKRLASLKDGYIQINMRHDGDGHRGRLTIQFEDSGAGFDYEKMNNNTKKKNQYSGRGIPLISQVCESLNYRDKGNVAEAVIRWPATEKGT